MNEIADHTRIVSVAEMQRLEKEADAAGQTYATMMEQAGTALAEAVQESFPGSADQSVLVLVGPGNNGGDGLVCARHLSDAGYRVRVYLWARGGYPAKEEQAGKGGKKKAPSRKTGPQEDYEGHLGQVLERNVPAHSADEDADAVQLRAWLDEADIVVDALLGTGANRPIEGALAGILQQLNEVRSRRLPPARTKAGEIGSATASETGGPLALSPLTVVAVDVPSGLNADSGALDPATVAADMTVTFGCAKAGQFLFPGAAVLGELVVADIGIPAELTVDMQTFFLTPEQVADLLPTRGRNSHKGIFGKGMAVVGSVNYPGAAFLSCAAMGRVGAGLVTGAIPQPVWVPLSSALAEPTWILLSHDLGVVNESAAANVGAKLGEYDALLIGCGLGQESATRGLYGAAAAPESQTTSVRIAERIRGVGKRDSRVRATGFRHGLAFQWRSGSGFTIEFSIRSDPPPGSAASRDSTPAAYGHRRGRPKPSGPVGRLAVTAAGRLRPDPPPGGDGPSLRPRVGAGGGRQPLEAGAGAGRRLAGRRPAQRTLYGYCHAGRRVGRPAGRHSCPGYGWHGRHSGRCHYRPAGPGSVSLPRCLPGGLAPWAGR